MMGALDDYVVAGLNHNIAFLSALVGHQRFARGELTTNFIAEEFPQGFHGVDATSAELRQFAAVAAFAHRRAAEREASIAGQLPGYEAKIPEALTIRIGGQDFAVTVKAADGAVTVTLDGKPITVKSDWLPGRCCCVPRSTMAAR